MSVNLNLELKHSGCRRIKEQVQSPSVSQDSCSALVLSTRCHTSQLPNGRGLRLPL
jgi:hypothetical protein